MNYYQTLKSLLIKVSYERFFLFFCLLGLVFLQEEMKKCSNLCYKFNFYMLMLYKKISLSLSQFIYKKILYVSRLLQTKQKNSYFIFFIFFFCSISKHMKKTFFFLLPYSYTFLILLFFSFRFFPLPPTVTKHNLMYSS